ncbi:MAG: uncharacterized protein KVP18_005109 [Porospora cf. gigantea A]|uniref:uncharacterized protein n=1 Tax=Porospora cf. gigantea A TaxID=2853593 RepID=UPI00355AA0C7|nr:MAG: hypothetical protein KVP18_005109 [Porospora cf. gigantea A]
MSDETTNLLDLRSRQFDDTVSNDFVKSWRASVSYTAYCIAMAFASALVMFGIFSQPKNTPVALWVQIVDAVLVFLLIIEIGIDIHVYGHRYFYKLSNIFDLAVVFTAVIGAALLFLEYRGLSTIDTRIAVTLLCVRYLFQTARVIRFLYAAKRSTIHRMRIQQADDVVLPEAEGTI